MKTMEEYLDEIADMVMGSNPSLHLAASYGPQDAILRVFVGEDEQAMEVGYLSITARGRSPEFDMEHACFNAGYLVGLAKSRLGNTETVQ